MNRSALTLLLSIAAVNIATACSSADTTTSTVASASAATGAGGATSSSSAATGGAGGAGGTDACAAQAQSFQDLLDMSRKQANAPGAVLAITTPMCGKWVGASGTSTKAEMMKPDDVLRIGSITKTFVATRTLLLVEKGMLHLDDALESVLPGFPNGQSITIRMLMNHTSGIFNYTDDPTFGQTVNMDPMKKWTPQELVDFGATNPPYFAPGTSWHYSNTNYILLGMIIEKITSAKIGPEIRTNLLVPQTLTSTSFDGEEAIVGHLAHGFSSGVDVSTLFDASYAWSAGAMVSSTSDLADWATKLYTGQILDPESMTQMLTTVDTGTPGVHYGLGVFVFDPSVALDTAYGHGGDIPGYHSQMTYLVNEKSAIVAIVNSDQADPNPITVAALEALVK